jgi:hypothetical protein
MGEHWTHAGSRLQLVAASLITVCRFNVGKRDFVVRTPQARKVCQVPATFSDELGTQNVAE